MGSIRAEADAATTSTLPGVGSGDGTRPLPVPGYLM
jgi:hypothetical protein